MESRELQNMTTTQLHRRIAVLETRREVEEHNIRGSVRKIYQKMLNQTDKLRRACRGNEGSTEAALRALDKAEDVIAESNRMYSNLITIGSSYVDMGRQIEDVRRELAVRDGSSSYSRHKAFQHQRRKNQAG